MSKSTKIHSLKLCLIFIFTTLIINSAQASLCDINFDYVCPYVGFDGQYRWVNPNNRDTFSLAGQGPSTFTMAQLADKSYPGFNAYFGGRYNWMGLEFGGYYGANRKNLGPLNLKTRFAGAYIDLVGYLPTPAECLELMGTLGFGYTATRTSFSIPSGGGFNGGGFSLSTQSGVVLPRLRIGANYMFNYWAGVRAW